jgi:hypothetical protein
MNGAPANNSPWSDRTPYKSLVRQCDDPAINFERLRGRWTDPPRKVKEIVVAEDPIKQRRLKETDVIAIRTLAKSGTSHRALAIQFNVTQVTIDNVVDRVFWKHVPEQTTNQ